MTIYELRAEAEECLHIGFCGYFSEGERCLECGAEKNCLQQFLFDKADALDIIKSCMKGV
jgi:hypothetical protein